VPGIFRNTDEITLEDIKGEEVINRILNAIFIKRFNDNMRCIDDRITHSRRVGHLLRHTIRKFHLTTHIIHRNKCCRINRTIIHANKNIACIALAVYFKPYIFGGVYGNQRRCG
jgi:hypothetical protein